jgi:hypothetical protein
MEVSNTEFKWKTKCSEKIWTSLVGARVCIWIEDLRMKLRYMQTTTILCKNRDKGLLAQLISYDLWSILMGLYSRTKSIMKLSQLNLFFRKIEFRWEEIDLNGRETFKAFLYKQTTFRVFHSYLRVVKIKIKGLYRKFTMEETKTIQVKRF